MRVTRRTECRVLAQTVQLLCRFASEYSHIPMNSKRKEHDGTDEDDTDCNWVHLGGGGGG